MRRWDCGCHIPLLGGHSHLSPALGDANPTELARGEGAAAPGSQSLQKGTGRVLAACTHPEAAGRRVLFLGNARENRGIDTYQVLGKIAELFSVLDSRAINSTGSGAG